MYRCARCESEFRDGVQCSLCRGRFDFLCAGITEGGYRKLGEDRRSTWKCSTCKSAGVPSPLHPPSEKASSSKSPVPADMESIAIELKRLTAQMSSLPTLTASVRAIQADIADMKTMKADIADLKLLKPELCEVKTSVEFVQGSLETLTGRITDINKEVQSLLKARDEVQTLQQRFGNLQNAIFDFEQRTRMNNIEIKGVPMTASENLFEIVSKVGNHIGCNISKEQINYVARIPMRNDNDHKNIIVSVHSRYLKENFVAAAKKHTLVPANLGLRGENRVYVNDHLTLENKMLLNKTKILAKERGYSFVWVRGCKIFARKNPTSPVVAIRSESDLKKFL